MIVPTIVKERWVVPPKSIETLETNLQSEKNKVASLVNRVSVLENNIEAFWGTLHFRLAELEKRIN
jgi:hypothetical protein